MAPPPSDQASDEIDRETALRARISDLEARLQRQAAELDSVYAMLGRERAERLRCEATLREEQRLTEALFSHSPIGIQIFDRQGFSLRLNEALRELQGLPDLTSGVGHYNVLTDPLQVVSGADEVYRRAYAGEVIHLIEQPMERLISADPWQTARKTIRYNQHLFPLYDEQGAVEAVIAFNQDVSEAYDTRQALSTAIQITEGLFEHAPLALQIFDRKGFLFRMNELNRRLLGAPTPDYGAGEFNALTDPFMVAQGHAALYARAYAGEVVRVPTLNIICDAPLGIVGRRTARVEQILFPILDEDGTVTAVLSCTLEAVSDPMP